MNANSKKTAKMDEVKELFSKLQEAVMVQLNLNTIGSNKTTVYKTEGPQKFYLATKKPRSWLSDFFYEFIKHEDDPNYKMNVPEERKKAFREYIIHVGIDSRPDHILRPILKTNWYVYIYDEKVIERLSLTIGEDENDIELIGLSSKYHGSIHFLNGIAEFDLKSLDRAYRLSFDIGKFSRNLEVCLGVNSTTADSGTIVATSAVMEKCPKDFKPGYIAFERFTEEFETIPKEIRNYLRNRRNNKIRTKSGVYSFNELFKHTKDKQEPSSPKTYRYDVYLSAPNSSLGIEERKKLHSAVRKIKSILENDFELAVYYEGMRDENGVHQVEDTPLSKNYLESDKIQQSEDHSSLIRFKNTLENMTESHTYVMFFPNEVCSGTVFRAGIASQLGMPIRIFRNRDAALPSTLTGLVEAYSSVQCSDYSKLDSLVAFIKKEGHRLFGRSSRK